jgi:aminoglycoside phosphotransferase family enzyme/predicted kinase
MIVENQREVVDFLSSRATHGGEEVERIETHASMVFLAGARAFKLKRAVRYDYLDFSTPARRRDCCEAEVRINSRSAPGLYRRVVPITRDATGALVLDGTGAPVDWVIEMARFDESNLFDRLAERGELDLGLMRSLGLEVAGLHAGAEARFDHGGATGIARVIEGNVSAFRDEGSTIDLSDCESLASASHAALERNRALLDRRRQHGYVRQCHGDLHLRNIVLLGDQPTLFDAIEFNDELSCIDVHYDLAFLLMDLWRRRLPQHANAVLNGYLTVDTDFDGLAAMPLFLSCRAAIRAKTSLAASSLASEAETQRELRVRARQYVHSAVQFLRQPRPAVVAIGGVSGTGKSTLAKALAFRIGPVPGAVVLRSDEVRKRLCGVAELTRLDPSAYTEEVSRRVYETLVSHARDVVRAGHSVIVDAVFTASGDRAAIERAADAASAPFVGIWLGAPESVLIDRLRRRVGDASDADETVARMQMSRDWGTLTWDSLDASADVSCVAGQALRLFESRVHGGVTRAA